MLQDFAALHCADNCCINGIPAVLVHIFNHFLLLIHRRKRHLDALEFVGELLVELEGVRLGDDAVGLLAWVLDEDLVLGTRQRVQQAHHILLRQVQAVLHLREAQRFVVVEEKQSRRLECGDLQLDRLRGELPAEHALAEHVDPSQLAVLCARLVPLLEHLYPIDHLLRQSKLDEFVSWPEASSQNCDSEIHARLLSLTL
mmetsp:Transcript_17987/g.39270  ORF Transcript_17987/g.39270 Transcript_17987/m.39270 type:complete len:200 (-) Transcript_17987:1011-1610(-)